MSNETRAAQAKRAGYVLRSIEPSDVTRVAEVHVSVWREAYTGLMRPDVLEGLAVARFERTWHDRLASDREQVDLVGVHPVRGIVGFGSAGPGRDEDAPRPWELFAINVLASEHGSGLADLLMASLLADRAAYLWVLDGNERAHAFYARYGFARDGRTKTRPGIGRAEHRLVRDEVWTV